MGSEMCIRDRDSNVAIHRVDVTASDLDDIISKGVTGWSESMNVDWAGANIDIDRTDYHHVLLFDWVEVSNFIPGVNPPPNGASGDDGYAEGSADFLYALLHGNDIADQVQSIIGYSRGGVVVSELAQRFLVDGQSSTTIDQVINLDAEGGNYGGFLYEDSSFYAWTGTRTDNYYSSTPDTMGGHIVDGARNFDDGLEYMHPNFPHYFIGDLDNGAKDGLFVKNGLIVTQDTPSGITGPKSNPQVIDLPTSISVSYTHLTLPTN